MEKVPLTAKGYAKLDALQEAVLVQHGRLGIR